MSYMIIQIPTKNSSNEVKSFIVIFIPLQLTLGRVIKCSRDHVRLMDDFSNGTTLAQKIVASSVFPVTEILAIEHNKLDCTFLHVAFGS
jgi:L-rhamnose isomerase